jgi:uncharacterized protein DUF6894
VPRYFFDLRDGEFIPDHEGMELPDMQAALVEAKRTLAEILEENPDKQVQHLMIDVREGESQDVYTVVATTVVEHTKKVPR